MKRKQIAIVIILSLLASLIVIFFPILFICDFKEAVTLGATILSGFAGVGTIVIALTLYEDIVGKRVIERQLDIVSAFLEELKSLQVTMICSNIDKIILYASVPIEKESKILKSLSTNNPNIEKFKVAFSINNYYKGMDKLIKLKSSIYMPPELVGDLGFIGPHVMQEVTKEELAEIAKIIINEKFDINKQDGQVWCKIIDLDLTVRDYIERMQGIITALESWVNRNAKAKIKLSV